MHMFLCAHVCVCVCVFTGCVEQTDRETSLHAPGTTEAHTAPVFSSASYKNSGTSTNVHYNLNDLWFQIIKQTMQKAVGDQ